jgi:zinc transporter
MVSLRFWIEEAHVIGVWLRRAYAVRDVMEAMERGIVPASPSDLLCKIAFRLVDRAEPIIAELSDQMESIERDEPGGFAADQSALIEIRQDASRLRRFLAPQRDALTTFAMEEFAWLSDRDQSRLKESAERFTRLGEELEQIRERAMIAHDEMLAVRSDRMNRTMLILAVLSTVFLPLGFLTGLFGINVGGMPGTDSPYAFWIVSGMSLILATVLWILIRLSKMMD